MNSPNSANGLMCYLSQNPALHDSGFSGFQGKSVTGSPPDTLLWGQVICNRREQGTLTLGSELGSEHDLVLATVGLKGFPFKPVLYLDLKQHNIKLLISKLNMLVFTSQAWKKDPVNREHNERLISKFKPFQVATVFFDTEVNLLTARYGLPFTSFHITSNVTHLKT